MYSKLRTLYKVSSEQNTSIPLKLTSSYDSICRSMDPENITYVDLVFHVPYPQIIQECGLIQKHKSTCNTPIQFQTSKT